MRVTNLRGGHHRFTRSQGRENCAVCGSRAVSALIHTERPAATIKLDGSIRRWSDIDGLYYCAAHLPGAPA